MKELKIFFLKKNDHNDHKHYLIHFSHKKIKSFHYVEHIKKYNKK